MKVKKIDKHDSLTDGFIPNPTRSVLPDKLINAFMHKYEQEGIAFTMSMADIKELLGLSRTCNESDKRVVEAIKILQQPIEIRNFMWKGREVDWVSAPFLSRAVRWKDGKNIVDLRLDDAIVAGLKSKAGYTTLELDTCNKFKSRTALKLYEMFIRYYSLPNSQGKGVGTVSKTLEELNNMFGTKYSHASKLLSKNASKAKYPPPINRALKKIEEVTGELVTCYFDSIDKKFVFSWHQQAKYPNLRIPYKRIDELIEWYISHNIKLKIANKDRYITKLKSSIIDDKFKELDEYWLGMLKYRYDIFGTSVGKDDEGKYLDFKRAEQKSLC